MKPRMSTVHFIFVALLSIWISSLGDVAMAQEGPIPPFKDNLFSSHKVLKSDDGGAYEVMDYNELRDITNGTRNRSEGCAAPMSIFLFARAKRTRRCRLAAETWM